MTKPNYSGVLAAVVGALAAAGMLVLLEARPADASFPGKNGKIAYVESDGHDREIYTISPGGESRFNVTKNNTGDGEPSYSPDGKKIAYVGSGVGKKSAIYTINVHGGSRSKVTNIRFIDPEGVVGVGPSWGSRLWFPPGGSEE
jgi:TolB protein